MGACCGLMLSVGPMPTNAWGEVPRLLVIGVFLIPALLRSMRFSNIKKRQDLEHLYQIVALLEAPTPEAREGDVMSISISGPAKPWVWQVLAWALIGLATAFVVGQLVAVALV